MKKIVVVIFVFALLIGSTAFAEDGVKVFLGYAFTAQDGKTTIYTPDGDESFKIKGLAHGPSLDVRVESGSLFARGTLDYRFLAGGKFTDPTGDKHPANGRLLEFEGDFGYKVLDQSNVSLTPYVGMGYWSGKASLKDITYVERYSTPYAAIGALAVYTQPDWSAGLDAALLLPFGGSVTLGEAHIGESITTGLGIGARVQLPLTYTIIPKKGNPVGMMVFLTPYYEYINSGKNDIYDVDGMLKIKYTNSMAGAKVGLGFAF